MKTSNFVDILIFISVNILTLIMTFALDIDKELQLFGCAISFLLLISNIILITKFISSCFYIKFKIVIENDVLIYAYVLTFQEWFLPIPQWKPIPSCSMAVPSNRIYTTFRFSSEQQAIKAIENTKEEYKRNRKYWFTKPERENKITKYL